MPVSRPIRQAGVLPPHRVLREVIRHYTEFHELVANGGNHVLTHSYLVPDDNGGVLKHTVAISFWDLHRGIRELAPRKREALFYNVILDQKQADVAKHMNITTVSVGQYVDAAMKQLCKHHFPDLYEGVNGRRGPHTDREDEEGAA